MSHPLTLDIMGKTDGSPSRVRFFTDMEQHHSHSNHPDTEDEMSKTIQGNFDLHQAVLSPGLSQNYSESFDARKE